MPEDEDKLRDEVIKALRDRVEDSKVLPKALAKCFRATNRDFSVAEPGDVGVAGATAQNRPFCWYWVLVREQEKQKGGNA